MGQRTTLAYPIALALAAAVGITKSAHAQTEPSPAEPPAQDAAGEAAGPNSADRTTARALAQEGYLALKSKDYGTAADRFKRAIAIVRAPTLLRDLARAQVGLGKLVDAHENYSAIIREGVAKTAPAPWLKAVADAKAEIQGIQARLPWVTITVAGPGHPSVTIDGAPIAEASLGVKRPIDPGRHEIRALGKGYYTAKKTVTLKEGESINVAFELEEAPPDAPPPDEGMEESKGKVVVTFVEPAWRKPAMISAYAVGGAGLVLGGVTGVLALTQHGKLSTDCARNVCGPKQRADLDRYHTFGQLATIGFVVAGVGAAAGTVLLFMRPQPQEEDEGAPSSPSVSVSAFLGVGHAGLSGTF